MPPLAGKLEHHAAAAGTGRAPGAGWTPRTSGRRRPRTGRCRPGTSPCPAAGPPWPAPGPGPVPGRPGHAPTRSRSAGSRRATSSMWSNFASSCFSPPLRVVEVLLAAGRVDPGGLDVPVRVRRDPHVLPGRRDDQLPQPGQRRPDPAPARRSGRGRASPVPRRRRPYPGSTRVTTPQPHRRPAPPSPPRPRRPAPRRRRRAAIVGWLPTPSRLRPIRLAGPEHPVPRPVRRRPPARRRHRPEEHAPTGCRTRWPGGRPRCPR